MTAALTVRDPRIGDGRGNGMRVAFIGLAWHQKTGSSQFLVDLLARHATVEQWSVEPGTAATRYWAANFHEDRYDVIVIWQLHEAFARLTGRHPNVVFVPMYDAMLWGGEFFWKRSFNTAKIVCFSWKLRQEVMRRGAVNAGFQYFPDPADHLPVRDFGGLRGFFWYRRREISPAAVFRLCEGAEFESFTVHDAPDPDNAATEPWVPPPYIRRFDRIGWSENRAAYASALRESNVFFAPRLFEGIGMSVLEGMASGHCVVAPNAPTMNEYIAHGTNGLLYVPRRPARLDFADAPSLGARARESVERGHERWLTAVPDLLDFITTPTACAGGLSFIPVRNNFAPVPVSMQSGPEGRPLVSVVTVCRDSAAMLETTTRSVLNQTGCDFEYVVLDERPTDGSVTMTRHHAGQFDTWPGTPGEGPRDAMNAALDVVRGEWLLFINAGDVFSSDDALRRMFARLPAGADVAYGHHIQRHADGSDELRRAADFETTRSRLRMGELGLDWLAGLPAQCAVAVRRDLCTRLRFDPRYRAAACLELLLRARGQGAQFFNCDEVIAFRAWQTTSNLEEYADAARRHGDAAAVDRLFACPDIARGAAPSTTHLARLGRLALRIVTVLDRHTPVLARAVERMARGPASRRVVRHLLARSPAPPAKPDTR
jgi:hypothetical protein